MNHDFDHCAGIDCTIRDNCYRYKAHLEVESGKYTYPVYYIDGCEQKVTKVTSKVTSNDMTPEEEKELGRKLHDEELRFEAWAEKWDEEKENNND